MLWQGKIFFTGITSLSSLLFWAEKKVLPSSVRNMLWQSFFIVTKIMLSHIISGLDNRNGIGGWGAIFLFFTCENSAFFCIFVN